MGALPPLRKLALTNPRLCLQLFVSAFLAHQYRFSGPFADPAAAAAVYLARPRGDMLESSITGVHLVLAWLLSFIWPRFTPNFGPLTHQA